MASEPSQSPVVVRATNVGKCYHVYDRPADRLRQALLRWRRQYYREFWALRDVSFEIRQGEALGILGRNGSGKSTLLQIIAGTLQPSEGEVAVTGRVAALLELGSGFNPEFTGRENVFMNGAILGLPRRTIEERFDEIASFADIGNFLDQPVKTYSSGMLVRLAFAVQVQLEPDILIVDEALAVGDALFQKRCYQRIEELRAQGVTLLFVSHDQETVRTLTSQGVLLHEGRMRSYGPSGEVVLDYRRLLHDEEKRYFAWHLERVRQRQAQENPPPCDPAPNPSEPSAEGPSSAPPTSPALRRDHLSFGDYDAEVTGVGILNAEGAEASVFYPGDPLVIRVGVQIHRDLEHLNVGLRIRNKQGIKIYSWGTLNQDLQIWSQHREGETFWDRRFTAGTSLTIDFTCPCDLGVNLYEVQAVVAEERDRYYGDQRILHWRDEAAFFQVLMTYREYFFGGTCDLRMTANVHD